MEAVENFGGNLGRIRKGECDARRRGGRSAQVTLVTKGLGLGGRRGGGSMQGSPEQLQWFWGLEGPHPESVSGQKSLTC